MYVMRATCPSPATSTPSYSCCATDIVRLAEKPSFLKASCCMVLVVNGGEGFLACSLTVTDLTTYSAPSSSPTILSTSWRDMRPSPGGTSRATNRLPRAAVESAAARVQYSSTVNACISRSRSQMSLRADDCTRPADSPRRTLRQRNGLKL